MKTSIGDLKTIILFNFYRKPMAKPCSNRKESALPEGNKVNTCVQECLRRFKNTSRDLGAEEITKTMNKYMGELAQGGYPYNWRKEVLSSALK